MKKQTEFLFQYINIRITNKKKKKTPIFSILNGY